MTRAQSIIFTILFSFVPFLTCTAQNLTALDIWNSMPDSVAPYLKYELKKKKDDLKKDEKSTFNTQKTVLQASTNVKPDTVTTEFLQAKISDACDVQLKLVNHNDKQQFVLIKTYKGTMADSQFFLYNNDWQLVKTLYFNAFYDKFFSKPDSLSQADYETRKAEIPFIVVKATLSPDNDTLQLTPAIPQLSKDEEKTYNSLIHEINLPLSDFLH